MPGADEKLIRVRGGPKGYRMMTLASFKKERDAKKGRLPKIKSPRQKRMEAKRKKTRQRKQK